MISEITLSNWTLPSSDTEIEKQERAERMIRQAIDAHEAFQNCSLKVYAKGSYANNTNVRSDSDVDIAVECTEALYWDESEKGNHQTSGNLYQGIWTPAKLRAELILAMKKKFPDQVDISGVTAIQINANSARVNADVVPCFSYRYYMKNNYRDGTKIFKTDGKSIVNYPLQQIKNGKMNKTLTSSIKSFLKEFPNYKHADPETFITEFLMSEYQNNSNFTPKNIEDFILNPKEGD